MQTEIELDVLFEKRHQEHLEKTRNLFTSYMQRVKRTKSNLLTSYTGWKEVDEHALLFRAKECEQEEGGYLLFLNGKGIAINPGRDFFTKICKDGYSLQDIDIVLATYASASLQEAIPELFHLNREVNRTLVSYGQDAHPIRFFLHPDLLGLLKPTSRQEREGIASLETFSAGEETYALTDDLSLAYMALEGKGVAIRIEAPNQALSLGYISHGGFVAGLQDFVSNCTLLIGAVGATPAEDLEQVTFQKDTLGFMGLVAIANAAKAVDLMLVSEFSQAFGDIRIELIEKLRKVTGARILPMQHGFTMHLDGLAIETSAKGLTSYDDVQIVRPFGPCSPLLYLAPCDIC